MFSVHRLHIRAYSFFVTGQNWSGTCRPGFGKDSSENESFWNEHLGDHAIVHF